ncbi:MAG: hypothetical protein ACHQPI_10680 [Thermoanaerobaculia bacterium]
MGEPEDRGAERRIRAAEEAARILKPFGGDGAKMAHDLLAALRTGAPVDVRTLKAVEAALLDALMSPKVSSKITERKTAFLHFLVPGKPARSEIRAAYKEFEAAFGRGASRSDPA